MHDLAALVLAAHTAQAERLGALVAEATQLDALQECGLPGDWGALVDGRRGTLAREALALLVRWHRLGGSVGLDHPVVAEGGTQAVTRAEIAAATAQIAPTSTVDVTRHDAQTTRGVEVATVGAPSTTTEVDPDGDAFEIEEPDHAWQARRVAELRARFFTGGDCDPSTAISEAPDALPMLGREYDHDDVEEPPECFLVYDGDLDEDDDAPFELPAEAVAYQEVQRARTTVTPFAFPVEQLFPEGTTVRVGDTASREATVTTTVNLVDAGAEGGSAPLRNASPGDRPASLESVGDLAALWGGAPRRKGDTSHFARVAHAPATKAPSRPPVVRAAPSPVPERVVAETVALEDEDDPPTDESPPSVPEDWPGFAHTRGKRALMVGGDPRGPNRLRLLEAFGFSELEWLPAEFSRNSLQRARERVRGGAWDLVIVLSRFVGHDADNVIQPACKLREVPFVPVPKGYGVTGVRRAIERHLLGARKGAA